MTEQMETANDRDNTGVNGTEPVGCHEDFDSDNDYGDIEVEDKMYSDSDKDTDDDDDDEGDDNNSDNDDENYDDDDINGDYVSDNDDGGGGEGDDDSDSGDDDDDQGDNDIENNEYNGEALHQDQDQILDPAPDQDFDQEPGPDVNLEPGPGHDVFDPIHQPVMEVGLDPVQDFLSATVGIPYEV
ncbi:uncharacterized protein LOC144665865 [Oculina patagonica]